mgnify:CR=1 FL=1
MITTEPSEKSLEKTVSIMFFSEKKIVPLQNSKEFVIALMKDKERAVQQYLQSKKVNFKKNR